MLDRFLSPQRKWRNVMIGLIGRIAALTIFVVAQIALAEAAALNVYSAIATRGALEELVPQFQKQTGQTLAITWGTAAMLTKRIAAGEPADVAILTRANIDSLKKDGKIEPDTDITLAQSSIAVAIKSGAPKPDISTPEKLKETLLKATAIAYSNPASGGASGVYFAALLERMGIADQMKAKTKFPPAGENSANLVVSGEAELAIQQKPELMNAAGVDIAGLLPGDLNEVTAFGAGITAGCKDVDAATALLKFLKSPEAAEVFKASGFEPDQ
jgi:molybdate transport system substrate-binding protein